MTDEKKLKQKRLQKAKYTLDELAALSRIASSPDFIILKRLIFRYIRNLKDVSFKLPEDNPQYLVKRHAELVGEASGARKVVAIIEASPTRLEVQEDEIDKLSD